MSIHTYVYTYIYIYIHIYTDCLLLPPPRRGAVDREVGAEALAVGACVHNYVYNYVCIYIYIYI